MTSSGVSKNIQLFGKAAYCIGTVDSAVLKVANASKIQWYSDGAPIIGATDSLYRVIKTGVYAAELQSAEGCIVMTDPKSVLIDKPRPGIRYPTEYAVIGSPYQLQARDFGSSVFWSPAIYLNNQLVQTPIFRSGEDQEYTIRLETSVGCVTVDTLLVKVAKESAIFVPTAFTPNNDGLNDVLHPVLMGIRELRFFRVYNRWGQLLFETRKPNTGWDGKISGKMQASDVVVWVAEGVGSDNRIYIRKGTSVLMR